MQRQIYAVSAALTVLAASACSSNTATNGAGTVPAVGQSAQSSISSLNNGDVFTLTNAKSGNAVLRYHRLANGTLQFAGAFATGGTGSGDGINGAGHTIQRSGSHLFASDAGSNDIASFDVSSSGLRLIGRFPSMGTEPASIAISNNLLYVLNAASNSITGFTIGSGGKLHVINGSEQSLTGSPSDDPVDLRFAAGGSALISPLKLANVLDVFTLTNGRAGAAVAHASAGVEPFGMDVTSNGHIIDSEAGGGGAGASTASSYSLSSNGTLGTISDAVPNHQGASCWLALTPDDAFAYVADTASSTLTAYTVAADGTIALSNASGVVATEAAGSAPSDIGVSEDGQFVYVLNEGTHTIGAFHRVGQGALQQMQPVTGLPAGDIGISVR